VYSRRGHQPARSGSTRDNRMRSAKYVDHRFIGFRRSRWRWLFAAVALNCSYSAAASFGAFRQSVQDKSPLQAIAVCVPIRVLPAGRHRSFSFVIQICVRGLGDFPSDSNQMGLQKAFAILTTVVLSCPVGFGINQLVHLTIQAQLNKADKIRRSWQSRRISALQ
jgi:hypothetical protein